MVWVGLIALDQPVAYQRFSGVVFSIVPGKVAVVRILLVEGEVGHLRTAEKNEVVNPGTEKSLSHLLSFLWVVVSSTDRFDPMNSIVLGSRMADGFVVNTCS